jgi:hypothetical protein
MSWGRAALREMFALFVDDAAYSAAIVAWVAVAALGGLLAPQQGAWIAPGLFLGCAVILVAGTCCTARRLRARSGRGMRRP